MITSQINIKCTSMIWCPATSLTVVYKMVNRLALYFDLATSSWARTLISGKRGGVRGWYMSSSHIRLFFRSSYVSFVRVDFSVLRICHICSQLLSVLLTYDDIYCTFHHLSVHQYGIIFSTCSSTRYHHPLGDISSFPCLCCAWYLYRWFFFNKSFTPRLHSYITLIFFVATRSQGVALNKRLHVHSAW